MKIHLSKPCRTPVFKDRRTLLRAAMRAAELVRETCGQPDDIDGELNIILAPRNLMRRLNEEFLGHSGDTDVIAFDYEGTERFSGEENISDEGAVKGEIYLCLPVAVDAAVEHGTSVNFEVLLYIVHGLLHLAGFDDHSDQERQRMRQLEQQVMSAVETEFGAVDVFHD
ncbi:MAG: rRNA maturation RNase YbeY [Verrucomicrobiota bacterium]